MVDRRALDDSFPRVRCCDVGLDAYVRSSRTFVMRVQSKCMYQLHSSVVTCNGV